MKKVALMIISFLLVFAMCFNLAGCSKIRAQNLMKNITAQTVEQADDIQDENVVDDFAVRLFKECDPASKNTLISPVSVMCAIAMAANGADGETLSQMENTLGMPIDQLNKYLYSYKKSLPQGEKYKTNLANSIWFSNSWNFEPNQEFLQTNANYYGADIYKAPFNQRTVKDINNWVNSNTDGKIPQIVDSIDDDNIMFLINALTFDAAWSSKYDSADINSGNFTCENGEEQYVKFMYSKEYKYLLDDNSKGFIKYYADSKYAFVALLPNENIKISEYVNSFTAEKINNLISCENDYMVNAYIPKFEYHYEITMNDILKQMGMSLAFDGDKANLSKLGRADGNLYIDEVLHKTFISVNEDGTKAAAATKVKVKKKAMVVGQEFKIVYLNRPFVYMIIDCKNSVPLFIGTVMSFQN